MWFMLIWNLYSKREHKRQLRTMPCHHMEMSVNHTQYRMRRRWEETQHSGFSGELTWRLKGERDVQKAASPKHKRILCPWLHVTQTTGSKLKGFPSNRLCLFLLKQHTCVVPQYDWSPREMVEKWQVLYSSCTGCSAEALRAPRAALRSRATEPGT